VEVPENVTLNCSIYGFPKPELSWNLNSEPLNKIGSSLEVLPKKHDDKYTCIATNKHGEGKASSRFRFKQGPTLNETTIDRKLFLDDSMELTCKTSGHPNVSFQIF